MEIDSIKKRVLEDVDPEIHRRKKKEKRRQRRIGTLEFLGIIVLEILILYMLMGVSTVQGESMYPTLHSRDIVFYYRRQSEYKTGDIVIIKMPGGEEFIKRVAAVAGDTVNIQGGSLYVNGKEETNKNAIGKTTSVPDGVEYPVTVADREVFVLGDNREVSEDSRKFGIVSLDDVKGKVIWYMGRVREG